MLLSTPPRGGQFGAGLLFSEGLLSDGPDTIIYQSLGARGAQGSPLNWLQLELEKWKRFGQDRKAMNNQSVSREYSYFQAWINVPLDKHTTPGNSLEEPASLCPRRKLVVTWHRRHCLLKQTDVLFMPSIGLVLHINLPLNHVFEGFPYVWLWLVVNAHCVCSRQS